jgi:hypothetical protein
MVKELFVAPYLCNRCANNSAASPFASQKAVAGAAATQPINL